MRAYGIRANNFSGVFGFNNTDRPAVGFRFITPGYSNVDEYIYEACMDKIERAWSVACEKGLGIRNIMIGTHKINKTKQMNMFFQDEEE